MTTTTVYTKVWCPDCGGYLGRHRAITDGAIKAEGGFEVASGMLATGDRTFGPNRRGRGSGHGLLVTKPGPITVRCRRCPTSTVVDIRV
jgi:hypothetical protein